MRSRFHPDARAEYVQALVYLAARRPGYGDKFEAEVSMALQQAHEFPGTGSLVAGYPEDVMVREFRLRSFQYSLMIQFDGDEVVVYAVAHQRRKPGYWRKRLK